MRERQGGGAAIEGEERARRNTKVEGQVGREGASGGRVKEEGSGREWKGVQWESRHASR